MSIGVEEPIRASVPGSIAMRRAAWALLALAMVASATLIWTWGQGMTLFGDEWGYAVRTATEPASTYLFNPPTGKHLIAVPLLVYQAIFETFGIDSDTPFHVAHLALLVLCGFLFFLLARRRVGDMLAALGTAILLFLGPAHEVVATPLRTPALISIAAGLGMLLLLERRDLKGDLGACALLAVSLASLSTGYPFAAAAAVLVLTRPVPQRWQRLWVFLIPVALYAAWWLIEFDAGPGAQPLGSTILDLPVYLAKAVGATVMSVTGLVQTGATGELILPAALYAVDVVLLGLLAGAIVARLRRPEPLSPFLLAMVAALLVFWIATAFAPGPDRVPYASRYLYLDAVLFLLFLAELARGLGVPRRLTRAGWAIVAAVFAIALAGNIRELHHQTDQFVEDADYIRAGLTSLQMAEGTVEGAFRVDTVLSTVTPERTSLLGDKLADNGVPLGHLTAYGYSNVFRDYGSPAYSPDELPSKSAEVRRAADVVLVRALGLRLRTTSAEPVATPTTPEPVAPAGAWRSRGPGCVELPVGAGSSAGVVALGTGGATVHAPAEAPVSVAVGRFGDGTPVRLGTVPAGGFGTVLIPPDAPEHESALPWRLGVSNAAGAVVCGSGPALGS
jgi:hypothetical protein